MTMDIADAVHGHERQTREGEPAGRTLASNVFERLRHDILECRLRPGTRLPFTDLRLRYGVGTSPLREALMRLASDGLVVLQDHRGFHVAPVSKAKLLDITFMRKEMETRALVLGIQNADEEWETRVVTAYHALTAGLPPWSHETRRAEPVAAPSRFVAGIPAALDELIIAMLARDPADRPASYASLDGVLRAIR